MTQSHATREALAQEARETYQLQATVEHPRIVRIIDTCGRLILIGRDINGWRADVYPSADHFTAGRPPAESDHLDGDDNTIMLCAHALAIANRVALRKDGI